MIKFAFKAKPFQFEVNWSLLLKLTHCAKTPLNNNILRENINLIGAQAHKHAWKIELERGSRRRRRNVRARFLFAILCNTKTTLSPIPTLNFPPFLGLEFGAISSKKHKKTLLGRSQRSLAPI